MYCICRRKGKKKMKLKEILARIKTVKHRHISDIANRFPETVLVFCYFCFDIIYAGLLRRRTRLWQGCCTV